MHGLKNFVRQCLLNLMNLTLHANTCLGAISPIGHKMNKIKGIAFDKDGTLIDFDASWAVGFRTLINGIFPNNIKHQNILANAAGFNTITNKFSGGSIFVNGTTQDVLDVWLNLFPELRVHHLRAYNQRRARFDPAFRIQVNEGFSLRQ